MSKLYSDHSKTEALLLEPFVLKERKLRQEDSKFKACLKYRINSGPLNRKSKRLLLEPLFERSAPLCLADNYRMAQWLRERVFLQRTRA